MKKIVISVSCAVLAVGIVGVSLFFGLRSGSCSHEWQQIATEEYLKEAASCKSPPVYYESCIHCGIRGDTFHRGLATDHSFVKNPSTDVLVKAADCYNAAVYLESCSVCGRSGDEYSYGSSLGHNYVNIASKDTLVEALNCTHPNIFVKTCERCGEHGEETFTLGSSSKHEETNGDDMCDFCLLPLKTWDDMDTSNKSHIHVLEKEEED